MKTKKTYGKLLVLLQSVLVVLMALSLANCGADDSNPGSKAGGMLSRDGDPPVPLFITNTSVSWHGGETTTKVFLSNWLTIPIGPGSTHNEQLQLITLTVPLDQLGQEVQLSASNASFSESPPTNNTIFPPIPGDFESTAASGTMTVFNAYDEPALLNPDHASGFFEVTFTDDDGNTRAITGGFFNF